MIQKQLEIIDRACRNLTKARDDVAPGGRLYNSTDESKCTRVWSALSGARALLIDLGSTDGCITTIIRTLTTATARYERGRQIGNYAPVLWLSYLQDQARYALLDISAARGVLKDKLAEEAPQGLTAEDEWAIRRAVWSQFVASGMQSAQCPYPIGHAHREIWADELAILAKEHCEQILEMVPARAPIARQLHMGDALREFGELPIGEVLEGEAIALPPAQEPRTVGWGIEEAVV